MFDSDEFNRIIGEEFAAVNDGSRAWEILGQNPGPVTAIDPSGESLTSFSGDFLSFLDTQGSSSADVTGERNHR
jgi:hypothetical protein